MRVVLKVARGLYFHFTRIRIATERIHLEQWPYAIPKEILDIMDYGHLDADTFEFRQIYLPFDKEIESVWLLTFYQRCTFRVTVYYAFAPSMPT
jgi:hypothetical protein